MKVICISMLLQQMYDDVVTAGVNVVYFLLLNFSCCHGACVSIPSYNKECTAVRIITAGNNYVSHTCHISNMCCSPTQPNAVFILVYMSFVSIRYYRAVLYAALHSYNLFVTWQHTSDYTLTGITYIHIYNNITYIYTGCM